MYDINTGIESDTLINKNMHHPTCIFDFAVKVDCKRLGESHRK